MYFGPKKCSQAILAKLLTLALIIIAIVSRFQIDNSLNNCSFFIPILASVKGARIHTHTMQQALTPGYNDGDECARKNSALLSTLKSGVHLGFSAHICKRVSAAKAAENCPYFLPPRPRSRGLGK